jgi:hypothetical protein
MAWTKGENDKVRVALVHVPEVDVRKVRLKMGLSQAQFATKFGFPLLLAVIAKHPAALNGVLGERAGLETRCRRGRPPYTSVNRPAVSSVHPD